VTRRVLLLLVAAGVLCSLLWWRQQQPETVTRSRLVMGTLVEISVTGSDSRQLHRTIEQAFDEMVRLEALFSPHIPDSEVAKLAQFAEMQVSPETADVIRIGLAVARRSEGAFDLTLGKLVSLWDVTSPTPRIPTPPEIEAALVGIGPEALALAGDRVRKSTPQLQLELGGVAKGYAVEEAAAIMRAAGVEFGSVNAGGDMALVGHPPKRLWRIGIRHPREPDQLLATLELRGGAVVTSGDYERFFEVGGERYHHLFDPRTGYPARGCRSVTVTAADAAYADALATAAFVLGPERGLALLERWDGVEGLLVAADGSVRVTTGLKDRVVWP